MLSASAAETHTPQPFTAQSFRDAIETYCANRISESTLTDSSCDTYSCAVGWIFREGAMPPRTCHLRRRFLLARREQQAKRSTDDFVGSSLQEINDDATATSTVAYSASTSVELAPLVVEQIVAYSSTWKVPILYFCAHEKEGTPLAFDDLIAQLVIHCRFDRSDAHNNGQGDFDRALFPSIGVGETPVDGESRVFLHPCQTATWLATLSLAEQEQAQQHGHHDSDDLPKENKRIGAEMESFMMLCSSTVEMRITTSQVVN